jgi:protein involved in polysaccharide export with SLBB domain
MLGVGIRPLQRNHALHTCWGDILAIRSIDTEEISDKPVPIGANGYITLPLLGRVLAAGLTIAEDLAR